MSTNNLDPPSNDPSKPDKAPVLLPDGRQVSLSKSNDLLIWDLDGAEAYEVGFACDGKDIFEALKLAQPRWAPSCTCIQEQSEHLKHHNKALNLTVFLDDRDDRIQVDIKELLSHQRVKGCTNKNKTLVGSFCTFCGRQYDTPKEGT